MPKIVDSKHDDAISWVNQLIADLKTALSGEQPIDPITKQRLSQWKEHRADLERCREL
jgi:hypothetical protein